MGRGEEGPLCGPGSELLLGGSARAVRGRRKKNRKNSVAEACVVTTDLIMRVDVRTTRVKWFKMSNNVASPPSGGAVSMLPAPAKSCQPKLTKVHLVCI